MANTTYTTETTPAGARGGPGCRWYQPSTHQWRTYNPSTGEWDIDQDGFDTLKVADLVVTGSVTVSDDAGITGTFEGTFKKIRIKDGIIIEFELTG